MHDLQHPIMEDSELLAQRLLLLWGHALPFPMSDWICPEQPPILQTHGPLHQHDGKNMKVCTSNWNLSPEDDGAI